jgi:hypothetical protein
MIIAGDGDRSSGLPRKPVNLIRSFGASVSPFAFARFILNGLCWPGSDRKFISSKPHAFEQTNKNIIKEHICFK